MPTATIADQWRGLNTQERDEALSRMTPEQKDSLAKALGYGEQPQPEARTVGNYSSEIARGVGRGLKNDVVGLTDLAAHPIKTAQGVSNQAADAGNKALTEFEQTSAAPMSQRLAAGALTFLENAPIIGGMVQHAEQGGTKMASPESAGAAAEGITTFVAPDLVAKIPVGKLARRGGEIVSGITPRVTDELVNKTRAANDKAVSDAAEKNAKIRSKRTEELNKHFEALQKSKGEEPTSLESGRPRTEKELQSHKQALNKGVEKLNTELQSDLKQTAKDVKAQADAKYQQVRDALGPKTAEDGEITPAPTIEGSKLADAVKNAENMLQGSSENIKVFRDILSKSEESDPDFIDSKSEGKIPKGHPLYDVLREFQKGDKQEGFTFSDLQGYYTELGDKLAGGKLPGDVYQSVKTLHDSIGTMMDDMAKNAGVLDKLKDAQQFYRGYMQTFRDPASPIYKAIKEPEPATTVRHLMGKDKTGIEAIAKYDPELARRANTIRAYKQEANSIRTPGTKAPKPSPKLGPKPPEVSPEIKRIGTEDVRRANEKALEDTIARRKKYLDRAAMYVTGYRALSAIGRAMVGDVSALTQVPADIAEGLTVSASGHLLGKLVEIPKIKEMLTKPTPSQLASIPPDVALGLQPVIEAAKREGIKVSPALVLAVAGVSNKSWYNQK